MRNLKMLLRNFSVVTVFCVLCFVNAVGVNAAPVQWEISAGGNGHWYEVILVPTGISWTAARDAAIARGGYLATITSAQENDFVWGLISDPKYWYEYAGGGFGGPYIGGYQDRNSQDYSEPAGGWQWVTDEPWSYTNWMDGTPDNYSSPVPGFGREEDHLQYISRSLPLSTTWNDINDDEYPIISYVLEKEVKTEYPLDVSLSGTGTGTVTSNPVAIKCPPDCSETFSSITAIGLTATANPGSSFLGWGNSCTGTGQCILLVDSTKSVTASFDLLKYQLNVNKTGTGTGTITSNPFGISCGGDCAESYNFGTSVTLTAIPDSKSAFSGWQGDCSGKSPCTLTMTGYKTATADFTSKLIFLPIILRNDYEKPTGTPPTLTNVTVSPNSAPAGSSVTVNIQFTFTDPDGDLDNGSFNFSSLSGQPVTIPLGNSFAGLKTGTGGGTLSLTLENQKGTFNIPCWLVDKAGNKSNFFYVQWTQY